MEERVAKVYERGGRRAGEEALEGKREEEGCERGREELVREQRRGEERKKQGCERGERRGC